MPCLALLGDPTTPRMSRLQIPPVDPLFLFQRGQDSLTPRGTLLQKDRLFPRADFLPHPFGTQPHPSPFLTKRHVMLCARNPLFWGRCPALAWGAALRLAARLPSLFCGLWRGARLQPHQWSPAHLLGPHMAPCGDR